MLEEVTGPVTVRGYRPVMDRRTKEAVVRQDGSPVEMVRYQAEGDTGYRECVLDAAVNGSRVEPGTVCRLVFASRLEADAVPGRDPSRPYVVWREKRRVTQFAKAS